MWITPDRLFCMGMLGVPAIRTMGSVIAYVAVEGTIAVSIDGGSWQRGNMAVIPPYVPHQVTSQGQLIIMIKLEAETVDIAGLPEPLRSSGVVDASRFVDRVRVCGHGLCAKGRDVDLTELDFDDFFFDSTPVMRAVDRRILAVMNFIKRQPSAPASAEDCAAIANLSFSRFLHLFKQEAGVSFRGFRTWKRARSLLHYVNKDSNLANIAQETGYADSTHFSHSIRQVYGQKPKEIFAGWRGTAVHANALC
jgi:AraC-like DNA-binding protein